MEKYLRNFNSFVSELVIYHVRMDRKFSLEYLSHKTGLSISFLDKAIHKPSEKHFNTRHLFLLSHAMNINISELIPSKENYLKLTNKNISEKEWNEFLTNIRGGTNQ